MKAILGRRTWRNFLAFGCTFMLLAVTAARAEDPVLVNIRSELGDEAPASEASDQDTEDALRRFLQARIEQSGDRNLGEITQAGSENYALIQQTGNGGDAAIIQSGSGNHAVIVQR